MAFIRDCFPLLVQDVNLCVFLCKENFPLNIKYISLKIAVLCSPAYPPK